ncbi:MAG TPA: 3-oxoadipate enol-lactonase [Candidatus Competibacteraceae bacterium]|nr:3-oxoadipate enol-lactonase [Candidatus Competibacteraceae bacterium]
MPFIDVDGARIHYRCDGPEEAPVLVLSNSLGTDLAMWDAQIPAFTQRFRVLRYDSRGHGQSAVTPGPYTIERLARDVLGLLDGLGLARIHFCGLSMGGMVGMWLGIHAPQRVARLVLCNTAACIPPAELWNARIEAVHQGGMAAIAEAVIGRWFTPVFRAQAPAVVERVRRTLEATPAEGYVACCAAVRDMDQRAAVARITAPTLVVAGTHDTATPPADGRFLAERIAGARYLELEAAHLSNLEAETRFTEGVLTFLTEQESR